MRKRRRTYRIRHALLPAGSRSNEDSYRRTDARQTIVRVRRQRRASPPALSIAVQRAASPLAGLRVRGMAPDDGTLHCRHAFEPRCSCVRQDAEGDAENAAAHVRANIGKSFFIRVFARFIRFDPSRTTQTKTPRDCGPRAFACLGDRSDRSPNDRSLKDELPEFRADVLAEGHAVALQAPIAARAQAGIAMQSRAFGRFGVVEGGVHGGEEM